MTETATSETTSTETTNTAAATDTTTATESPFYSGFNDDLKGFIETKGYESPEAIATALREYDLKGDMNKVALPDFADEAATNEFYKTLGRPDTADAYELPELPEGLPMEKETEQWKRETAFKLGLNQKQATELANSLSGMFEETIQNHSDMIEQRSIEQEKELKKEWGNDFDMRVELAKRAANEIGFKDELPALEQALGTGKAMKLLYEVGKFYKEGNAPDNIPNSVSMSPAMATAEINKLMADETFRKKYMQDSGAERELARARMAKLEKIQRGEYK